MVNIFITYVLILGITTASQLQHDYGMVIDAGSTHSALFVYQFKRRTTTTNKAPQSVPVQIAAGKDLDPVTTLKNQNQSDHLIQVNNTSRLPFLFILPC